MTGVRPKPQLSSAPALALLFIRGFLIWFVVPIAVVVDLTSFARFRGASSMGQYLGWVDLNLIALIERTVLRPVVREPMKWASKRNEGSHSPLGHL